VDLRDRSWRGVEEGAVADSRDRFADALLNRNRCDLKVPLGPPPVHRALRHLLSGEKTALRGLIGAAFDAHSPGGGGGEGGDGATLYELNCFMSRSGARRQLVHADSVCFGALEGGGGGSGDPSESRSLPGAASPDRSGPAMLTCFVALQDVDESMGPTYFLPGTNNLEAHRQFFGGGGGGGAAGPGSKEALLSARRVVAGTLRKGSCVLFDPRTLHCAGANRCQDPDTTRALFYFTFKSPRVDSPGSPSCGGYGIPGADLSLRRLCAELEAEHGSPGDVLRYPNLAMLASNP
jgi:hypothetical protein